MHWYLLQETEIKPFISFCSICYCRQCILQVFIFTDWQLSASINKLNGFFIFFVVLLFTGVLYGNGYIHSARYIGEVSVNATKTVLVRLWIICYCSQSWYISFSNRYIGEPRKLFLRCNGKKYFTSI